MPIVRHLARAATTLRVIWRGCGAGMLALLLFICATQTLAQTPAGSETDTATISTAPDVTAEQTQSRIDELEARKDIDPAARDQALALYRKALSQLEAAKANSSAAAKFQDAIKGSPKLTAEVKKQLAGVVASAKENVTRLSKSIARSPLGDVEQQLNTTQGEVATLKTELGQLETKLRDIASRPTAARTEQSAQKKKLDELVEPRNASGNSQDSPIVADAQRAAISAERLAVSAKVNLLEQELISLPAREALTAASRDLAAAKLDILKEQIPVLESRVNELRKSDALQKQAQADSVTRELSGKHPVLEKYAKTTSSLHQTEAEITRSIESAQSTLTGVNSEISRIKDSLTAAQQILEIGSVGEELGEYLRVMRAQLPSISGLAAEIRKRDAAIVDARLKRLNVDQGRRAIADPELAAKQLLATADLGQTNSRADLQPTLVTLMKARSESLNRLSEAHALRIEQLAELSGAQRELLNQTEQLNSLLNSRLLWLPSSAPLGWLWLEQIKTTVSWLTDWKSWKLSGISLSRRIADALIPSALVFVLCGLILVSRRRLRQKLDQIADSVGKVSTDNFLSTPQALLITALIALPWPVLIGYLGWLLARPPEASEFATSVGNGLLVGSVVVLAIRFLQLLCMPRGVLRVHFDWSERACQMLIRNLSRLALVAVPTSFLIGMIEVSKSQIYRDGIGRLTFLVGAIALAVFAGRVLNPRRGMFAARLSRQGAFWLMRGVWYFLLSAAPLALAALAMLGYYDSASELQMRLGMTVAIAILGLIAYAVAMRQVLMVRRRLEILRAQERRKKAREAAATQAESEATGDATPRMLDISEVDVASISQQTRTLLRLLALVGLAVGLWLVWQQLLPALGVLDNVALWTQTITTDAGTKVIPVTLSNLLLGLIVGVITFIAARNLPGLLEFMFLQRLAIEPGTRYAITAISRYSIVAVGLLIAFERIGADWSQMQWIIAALGVGVGFGLQEIVANFISGLIILFERPVRVGDTVTIGDLSGTVSRIQIRATSITDWDNHEILVPNKSLITDKVVNWTLSDPITRLLVKIGIAYGSDTVLAQRVILETVKANPLVLEAPSPSAFFLGFGDSSLNYEIRAFVAQPSHRLLVMHELHMALDRAMREHNIEIPFPQRDLHLKFADPAEGRQDRYFDRLRKRYPEAAE